MLTGRLVTPADRSRWPRPIGAPASADVLAGHRRRRTHLGGALATGSRPRARLRSSGRLRPRARLHRLTRVDGPRRAWRAGSPSTAASWRCPGAATGAAGDSPPSATRRCSTSTRRCAGRATSATSAWSPWASRWAARSSCGTRGCSAGSTPRCRSARPRAGTTAGRLGHARRPLDHRRACGARGRTARAQARGSPTGGAPSPLEPRGRSRGHRVDPAPRRARRRWTTTSPWTTREQIAEGAGPAGELWVEPGFGHAENALTEELAHRIARWGLRAAHDSAQNPAQDPAQDPAQAS